MIFIFEGKDHPDQKTWSRKVNFAIVTFSGGPPDNNKANLIIKRTAAYLGL